MSATKNNVIFFCINHIMYTFAAGVSYINSYNTSSESVAEHNTEYLGELMRVQSLSQTVRHCCSFVAIVNNRRKRTKAIIIHIKLVYPAQIYHLCRQRRG